ncbi:hypothetical protein BU24DRAFT_56786 [Aaosphaeria arxii CBS 175.79]|uniref:Zn(2)-C6 fungal-type domain-containing protein n=1 Tax=Aaosphaeria arxii CBS 175.79 TaxID=1450172 RepID=A0A6A5XBS8_9PLEO|nr:uncharacterized protein BU24DRAFT_56786 [Aaosphaeria arxii CBS 175.79]KAF2010353.1 hypothetical protein BU24DRAFT_56786 [Aaosphaeria arxii CBS 175.79]
MNSSIKVDPNTNPTSQPPAALPKYHNPYTKMSSRRAIACTICAKAKTKCDKLVPSCSRCTAKGLQCEPRSTRRTSDNSYRNPRKHLVSPKRYPTTNSIPNMSRHSSPRSVPDRHRLVRAVSQMDFHQAAKFGQHRPDFATMSMLTPLQTYTPHIVDECYSYSSSPEQNMSAYTQPPLEKNKYLSSGRLTPQTPESVVYNEPVNIMDPFDPYMDQSTWTHDGQIPIGLGFGDEVPGLMPSDQLWSGSEADVVNTTSMGSMGTFETPLCGSPGPMNAWPNQAVSMSPPQLPHSRAVPALSMSESSVHDFDSSPNNNQDEWPTYMGHQETSTPYFDSLKAMSKSPQVWDDNMLHTAAY